MMAEADIPRRRFRPTLWPTVFTIPALALLIALGSWQVQRLHWKETVIAEREAALARAPQSVDSITGTGAALSFHPVSATGVFLHNREIYMDGKSHRSNPGGQVVTPLRLDRGGVVYINRGWVPRELRDPGKRLAGRVAGPVTVTGILRRSGRKSDWIPENQPEKDVWYSVDVVQMAKRHGLAGVRPFYIEAGPAANPGGWPMGRKPVVLLSNNHLQYAFTWYSFAVVLLVIYVIYHTKRPDEEKEDDDVGL
jgi:surfeit locus 1 family protein